MIESLNSELDATVGSGARADGATRVARKRRARTRARVGLFVARALTIAVLLAVWQFVVQMKWVDEFYISKPTAVAFALMKLMLHDGSLWINLSSTLLATVLGFAIGAALGVLAGLLLAGMPYLDAVLEPLVTGLNSLPRIALAPLFILWFGIGIASKTAVAVSLVFFIMLITTRSGLKNADPDLLTVARLMGADRRRMFTTVILPISVPSIFAGLQLATIYSFLAVVVSEIVGADHGLGVMVSRFSQTLDVADTFAVLFILALCAAGLNLVTRIAESWFLRWQKP